MKLEGLVVDEVDALIAAAKRLREIDEDAFRRVLACCRALVANHDRELESDAVWKSRMLEIDGGTHRGSA